MILKFNSILEIVDAHMRAKSQQAKCSGSWVINNSKLPTDLGQL